MLGQICAKSLFGLSLTLLIIIGILDARPLQIRSISEQQPAFCREARPKSSADSVCDNKDIRYLLHPTNPRGCKKFGICSEDSVVHDNLSNENYFLTYETCQKTCMQHVTCPEPVTEDENVILVSDNDLIGWGQKLVYTCSDGYSLSDKSERLCQKNGTWSGSAPVCLEQCEPPLPIEYGHIAPSNDYHNQGRTVHYTCNVGYQLEGSPIRTCGVNGTWMGMDPPHCVCQFTSDNDECLSCPEPSPLNHGNVMAPNRSMGSMLEYKCNSEYIMIGNPKRECTSQGEWSGEEPICWRLDLEIHERYSKTEIGSRRIVTNTSVNASSATSYSMSISVVSSDPNPFKRGGEGTEWTEAGEWTYISTKAMRQNRKGKNVSESIKINNSLLNFGHIYKEGEQNGTYSFTLGNYTVWFELVAVAPIQMEEAPNILVHPTLSPVVSGGEVQLSCVMMGCPAPTVSWYKDGVELHNENRLVIDVIKDHILAIGNLKIKSVTEEDKGIYWCTGSNGVGDPVASVKIVLNFSTPQEEVQSEPTKTKRSIMKRSSEDIRESLCDSNSPVILVGQVSRDRVPSTIAATYQIKIKELIRAPNDDVVDRATTNTNNLRTIVLDDGRGSSETNNERLSKNIDYIFRGRFVNKTFVVSKQNIHRHNRELEKHISTC